LHRSLRPFISWNSMSRREFMREPALLPDTVLP
jgi:hypothetical protein